MEPFTYLKTYRVPVCKKCEFACIANEVPTHLQTRHQDIPPAERRRVAQVIGNISDIIKDQSGLEDFQFPPPTISSVAFLAPPKPDRLKCQKCPYIVKHKNPQCRGRPRQADSELEVELLWIEGVLCQRFFPSRRGSRYAVSTELRDPIIYKNVRRDILQAMTRLPIRTKAGSDEEKIMCFLSAVNVMLNRCELTAENTDRVLLYWLASSRLDICQVKPFALKVEQNTRKGDHEVKINLNARLKSQIKHLWEH
ncbi:Uncharacterized protein HZ326_13829 [Fusarium oxysporum f. sp. albedinis]|nr:Uncharacterized protein HZ326_13829 [Fusarium oxysporum f. sp. albedinis]